MENGLPPGRAVALRDAIRDKALALGFDAVGFARLRWGTMPGSVWPIFWRPAIMARWAGWPTGWSSAAIRVPCGPRPGA
jgi:hypothetical protein